MNTIYIITVIGQRPQAVCNKYFDGVPTHLVNLQRVRAQGKSFVAFKFDGSYVPELL